MSTEIVGPNPTPCSGEAWGKPLGHFMSQFLHLQNGENNTALLKGLTGGVSIYKEPRAMPGPW